MNKTLEIIICAFLMLALAFFIVMVISLAEQTKGVNPILKMYNKVMTQCSDDACRKYTNVFYIQILRDLTGEPVNDK